MIITMSNINFPKNPKQKSNIPENYHNAISQIEHNNQSKQIISIPEASNQTYLSQHSVQSLESSNTKHQISSYVQSQQLYLGNKQIKEKQQMLTLQSQYTSQQKQINESKVTVGQFQHENLNITLNQSKYQHHQQQQFEKLQSEHIQLQNQNSIIKQAKCELEAKFNTFQVTAGRLDDFNTQQVLLCFQNQHFQQNQYDQLQNEHNQLQNKHFQLQQQHSIIQNRNCELEKEQIILNGNIERMQKSLIEISGLQQNPIYQPQQSPHETNHTPQIKNSIKKNNKGKPKSVKLKSSKTKTKSNRFLPKFSLFNK